MSIHPVSSDRGAPVIVGVDGSASARNAALWAGAVAERFDAPLRVVHGMPPLGSNFTEAAAVFQAALLTYQAENAESFVKDAADAVRRERPGLSVTTSATSNAVDEVLVDASRHARFVVLGGMDISPTAAVLLGSTTLDLVTRGSCPVVAWRGTHCEPTADPVVVGVDDTPAGRAALATAFEVAERFGVALHAVHSWASYRLAGDVKIPLGIDWEAIEALNLSALTELVDEYHRDHRSVQVECYLDAAGAARAVLEHLDRAQLVVVGNRGRSALAAAALGSTSLNLLHHSPVPVMVCHPPAKAK